MNGVLHLLIANQKTLNEGRDSIPVILVLSQGGIIWVICGSLCNSRMRRRTSIFGIKCSLKINTRPVSNDIHAIKLYIYDVCHDNKVLGNIVFRCKI